MNNLDKSIKQYIDAAINHGEGLATANSKLANKSYKILAKCYDHIKLMGDESLSKFSLLLDHSNDSVKLWTARFALNIKTEEAVRTLTELSVKTVTSVAFSTKMTLSEWEKGNLKF